MSFHLLPLWSRMIMIIMIPYVFSPYNRDTRPMSSLIGRTVSHWRRGDVLGNHSISVIPVRCGMMGKLRSESCILWRVDAGLPIPLVLLLKVRQWSSFPQLLITSMDALHTNRSLMLVNASPRVVRSKIQPRLYFQAVHTNPNSPQWLWYTCHSCQSWYYRVLLYSVIWLCIYR